MQLISGVFHPLLMAVYMSAILAQFLPEAYAPYSQEMGWRFVLAFALLTAFFPAISVLGLYLLTPWVTHLELHERKERILPFFILIFFYSITGKFLIFDLDLGTIIKTLLISAIAMIGLLVVINTRFKISIHCASIWALAGFTLALSFNYPTLELSRMALVLLIVAGLVGTSRLYLGYHQPKEVWAGSMMGFFYSLGTGYFLL